MCSIFYNSEVTRKIENLDIKIKTLCFKGCNKQSKKVAYGMGENMCKSYGVNNIQNI